MSRLTIPEVTRLIGPELASLYCDGHLLFDESDYRDADDGVIYLAGTNRKGHEVTATVRVIEVSGSL